MRKALLILALLTPLVAQILSPIMSGGHPYYVDAVTGAGSDANPGTAASPWATVTHADGVLSANAPLMLKYPDGNYYTAPPLWHSLKFLFPFQPGADLTKLYDVANGKHGTLGGPTPPVWMSTGALFCGGLMAVGSLCTATANSWVTAPDLITATGPTTVLVMHTPYDNGSNVGSILVDAGTTNRLLLMQQNAVTANVSGLLSGASAVINTTELWGQQMFGGTFKGSGSGLYRDGALVQTGTLTQVPIMGSVTIGATTAQSRFYEGIMQSIIGYGSALSSGDVATLNVWETTVEQPRTRSGAWDRYGAIVLPDATEGGHKQIEEPSLICDSASGAAATTCKLWYTEFTNNATFLTTCPGNCTASASWTKQGLVQASCQQSFVMPNPGGAGYWMYCRSWVGTAPSGAVCKMNLYTSSNGVSWALDTPNVITCGAGSDWDAGGIANPTVIADAGCGGYCMLYSAYNLALTASGSGLATSPDGRTWTKLSTGTVPTFPDMGGPHLLKSGSTYVAWFGSTHEIYRWKAAAFSVGAWAENPVGASAEDPVGATFARGTRGNGTTTTPAGEGPAGAGAEDGVVDPFIWDGGAAQWLVYVANQALPVHTYTIKLAVAGKTLAQLVASKEGAKRTDP